MSSIHVLPNRIYLFESMTELKNNAVKGLGTLESGKIMALNNSKIKYKIYLFPLCIQRKAQKTGEGLPCND